MASLAQGLSETLRISVCWLMCRPHSKCALLNLDRILKLRNRDDETSRCLRDVICRFSFVASTDEEDEFERLILFSPENTFRLVYLEDNHSKGAVIQRQSLSCCWRSMGRARERAILYGVCFDSQEGEATMRANTVVSIAS
eukprot:gb/GECG01011397.1/.p1 GENE.gb/GECG01011397.1/~~gb/GECG01011397.1/.p1  ORF type:complete len:141 (+),score=2.37 gb/GECG01011397.1/:1-423(+)